MNDNEYTFSDLVLFVSIGALAFMSIPFVISASADIQLGTAIGTSDVRSIQFEDNWTELGTLNNLDETPQGSLTAVNNQNGTYTSDIFDIPRNRVLEIPYSTDLQGGSGNVTVNAWTDFEGSPDETVSFQLEEGQATEQFNLTEQNFFEIVIELEDQATVDSFQTDYEVLEGQQSGIPTDVLAVFFALIMLFAVSMLMFGLAQNPLN